MSETAIERAGVVDLRLEVRVAAPAEVVWNALTADIGRWWPTAFYCGSGEGPPRFVLEARPGGRMWEDWGAGDGLLWGTVVLARRAQRLEIVGTVGPAWGGPSTWHGGFELRADGDATLVRFAEASFGRIPEDLAREKEKGWRILLDTLAAHVEGR